MSKVRVQAKAEVSVEVEAETDEEAIAKAKAIPSDQWEIDNLDVFEGFDTLWMDP